MLVTSERLPDLLALLLQLQCALAVDLLCFGRYRAGIRVRKSYAERFTHESTQHELIGATLICDCNSLRFDGYLRWNLHQPHRRNFRLVVAD